MKKLINFENHKEIQELANNKYGGNFSAAVTSIINIAISSGDFINDIDMSTKAINGECLTSQDAVDFTLFLKTDAAKIAGLPSRFIDAAMFGFDACSFNERFKMLLNCDSIDGSKIISKLIYDTAPITESGKYLKTAVELAAIYLSMGRERSRVDKLISERDYHDKIVDNFNDYFSGYSFVGSEWITNDGADRIDILASCNKTDRDVIIELKLGAKSGHKQLRSYAYEFKNPILINISEDTVLNKRDGIQYLTYSEIGITGDNDE